jgi:3-methyladenine DNA glycosylase AlkD
MTTAEILRELESKGSAQTRKTYGRHGVQAPLFGVSYADLGKLKRKIKTDHGLALSLWETGNHDARVLATMVADPDKVTNKFADTWVGGCANHVLAGAVADLVGRSPVAEKRALAWAKHRGEWKGAAGYSVLAMLAADPGNGLGDGFFRDHLETIEAEIHARKSRVRYSMLMAVINIGLRSPALEKAAVAATKRIGPVEVDHGETACQTPEPIAYIAKTKAYRAKKAKERAARAEAKKAASAHSENARGGRGPAARKR